MKPLAACALMLARVPAAPGAAAELAEFLRVFRRDERSVTVMHQIAPGFSDTRADARA